MHDGIVGGVKADDAVGGAPQGFDVAGHGVGLGTCADDEHAPLGGDVAQEVQAAAHEDDTHQAVHEGGADEQLDVLGLGDDEQHEVGQVAAHHQGNDSAHQLGARIVAREQQRKERPWTDLQ